MQRGLALSSVVALVALGLTRQTAAGLQTSTSTDGGILVSLSGEDKVVLIDPSTGAATATFPVVTGPHELVVSSDQRSAYVANAGRAPDAPPGTVVSVLDLTKQMTKANYELSYEQPHDVRISRDATTLWVACAPRRVVVEIDAHTGALKRTWRTGVDGGYFVAVSPDERKVYVPHLEG